MQDILSLASSTRLAGAVRSAEGVYFAGVPILK